MKSRRVKSAEVPTNVKEVVTLLVKSAPCNFHWHQGTFHRVMVSIFLRFKYGMSKPFPTNLGLNQQSRSCPLHGFRTDGEGSRQLEKHTGMDRRDCSRSATGESTPTGRQALRMTDARGVTSAWSGGRHRMEGAHAATIFAGLDLGVHSVSRTIASNRRAAVKVTMPACVG